MYLIVLGWMYVVVLMAAAQALSPDGSMPGAIVTLFFYGLLPLALVLYLVRTPQRRQAMRRAEAAPAQQAKLAQETAPAAPAASDAPDAGGHAPAAAELGSVAAVRKEA
ncbi:hypothetical protein [Hydrogenophaga sp.]|uniref:hypothetical protein n=1 Tax=Hydrogenophaga sp. TaxID=1904254 RepID=UPI0019B3E751|nr:hypothetical protein [Hydrogenophaga sp.]MBD3893006.1 hypothetical protein [Hydrogenophaga sp.]